MAGDVLRSISYGSAGPQQVDGPPEYVATIWWDPTVSADVVQVAVHGLIVAMIGCASHPIEAPSAVNFTVPVGFPIPLLVPFELAVNVTGCANCDGFTLEATVVAVVTPVAPREYTRARPVLG
jgi:hypothetical protein